MHQLETAGCRVLALARAHRHARPRADVAQEMPVVVPAARLLEPDQADVLDEVCEAQRLGNRPGLVRVRRDEEIIAARRPCLADARDVVLGRERADLELDAGQTELPELRDLLGDAERAVAVAGDRDHRQARAVATPQLPERCPERLADRVPDRGVDAGAGDETAATVAQDVEGHWARQLPALLGRERVRADESRGDLLAHDTVDLEQVGVLVTRVRLADDPLVGDDTGHERRAVGHLVGAAAVGPCEWHPERDRLDRPDREPVRHGRESRSTR